MEMVNGNSKLKAQFSVNWQEKDGTSHADLLWSDQINMWRDLFPQNLALGLHGCGEGEGAQLRLQADKFNEPYQANKVVSIAYSQFQDPQQPAKLIEALPGRYYPQGYLRGVSGAFPTSVAPSRCLARNGSKMDFDLNHPLAGYDLEIGVKVEQVDNPAKPERGGRCEDWLERICGGGPGMQARLSAAGCDYFGAEAMQRQDQSDDQLFYQQPRLVHHLDSTARQTIAQQYGSLLAERPRVLDLMSSWQSHLPEKQELASLTVVGLNGEELQANSRASERLVHDLNHLPVLPFADSSFDAVICTASIEYLTRPLEVLQEVERLLVPGGLVAIAFSNRWFAPKAVQVWQEMHEFERLGMVLEMLHQTKGLEKVKSLTSRGKPRPEDDPHQEYYLSDPVFMAWARKKG